MAWSWFPPKCPHSGPSRCCRSHISCGHWLSKGGCTQAKPNNTKSMTGLLRTLWLAGASPVIRYFAVVWPALPRLVFVQPAFFYTSSLYTSSLYTSCPSRAGSFFVLSPPSYPHPSSYWFLLPAPSRSIHRSINNWPPLPGLGRFMKSPSPLLRCLTIVK